MSESDYHCICKELDNLAIKVLDILENILIERYYLDELLKDGYMNMAKSRYLMGSRNIGILQVNSNNMNARTKVTSEENNGGNLQFRSFSICDSQQLQKENKFSTTLKHRTLIGDEDKLTNDMQNCIISKDECANKENIGENFHENADQKKSGSQDPLRWFGILVPQNLKTCQQRFVDAINVTAKVASLQSELQAACKMYRELIAKKRLIQHDAPTAENAVLKNANEDSLCLEPN